MSLSHRTVLIAPQRQISSFRLSPTIKEKMISAGITVLQDLKDMRPTELAKEIQVSNKQALDILQTIKLDLEPNPNAITLDSSSTTAPFNQTDAFDGIHAYPATAEDIILDDSSFGITRQPITGTSAFALLEKEQEPSIMTFSKDIDDMLGGGVQLSKVTEFCGVPGIGKTQMGMQLAVNVQIPDEYNGVNGQAIYIDTEGSFMTERMVEIAESLTRSIKERRALLIEELKSENPDPSTTSSSYPEGTTFVDGIPEYLLPPELDTDKILNSIYYYRLHDYIEQIALVNILPSFLRDHPLVRLIVIDSVAFLFRHGFDDLGTRTRLLQSMANQLNAIASQFQVAIVLINQVTTKFQNDRAVLVPALGETWSHAATNRVMLFWEGSLRKARLIKSPNNEDRTVTYCIVPAGIRSYTGDDDGGGGGAG
eukprot:TRINITY_DN1080_c4_g1_i1.p1 TRINITY_DN1080_c4_g1~~TRINITY_DN1080_c4_g1_i1.p1  ORF type:complete len:425 (+),score=99.67 TRINITY_DN1080_c4_g1_i1:156-1430(+)